jgi:peptidoglycan/xylan/chitin deacetylase (PgdA/CDA1 family)
MSYMWKIASSLWHYINQRDQLLIVTLHRIDRPYGLPVSTVEKSLKFLAGRYRFVLPEELQHTDVHGKMAMLTVDDGHMEVFSKLYPIIQSLNISMVICITTDFFLRNRWLWVDKIHWILEQPGSAQRIQSYILPENASFSGNQAQLRQYFKTLPPNTRDGLIDSLADHCGIEIPPKPDICFRPVRTKEVSAMLQSGMVELASHTVTHPILMNLSDHELDFELQHSKKELEDFSGRMIHSFCYPNGLPGDYDSRTIQAVNRAGYSMAFTSNEGINYKGNTEWNQLKRVHIHRTPHTFQRSASGLTEVLGRLRHR